MTIQTVYAAGDTVVQIGRTAGTVNATGASFDVQEVHLLTVRDGKVVRFEAHIDTPAMLEALRCACDRVDVCEPRRRGADSGGDDEVVHPVLVGQEDELGSAGLAGAVGAEVQSGEVDARHAVEREPWAERSLELAEE